MRGGGEESKKKRGKYRESASKGAPLSPPSLQITATRICFFLHPLPPPTNCWEKMRATANFPTISYTPPARSFAAFSSSVSFYSAPFCFLFSFLVPRFFQSFSLSSQIINSVSFFHPGTRLYFSFLDTQEKGEAEKMEEETSTSG